MGGSGLGGSGPQGCDRIGARLCLLCLADSVRGKLRALELKARIQGTGWGLTAGAAQRECDRCGMKMSGPPLL